MVKVHTIEMIEHSSKNFPNVKAHTDMINGSLVGMGDGVTVTPTAENLYVVLNVQTGDKEYADVYPIATGDYVSLYDLKNWTDKELDITEGNIEGDYADFAVDTELTFDADTFKFKVGTATGGVGFKVTKRWGNIVNGLTVKIIAKD